MLPDVELAHLILFTFHAHGTWLPDRDEGFYKNKDGLRPPDDVEAGRYRTRMGGAPADFDDRAQRVLIEAVIGAAGPLDLMIRAVATDPAHAHVLCAWTDHREPEQVQRSLKHSVSRALNLRIGQRQWLGRNGHDRRVRDEEHLVHLLEAYLPSHRGWKWDTARGWFK